jgi:putative acetyltransferase
MRAVRFYLREGFRIVEDGTDENTGEKEYLMRWEKESIPGKDRRN